MTRRTVAGTGLALAATPAAAASDPLSGPALYADLKAYAALGHHRTGTAGDRAATVMLERALKAAGYQGERQGFDYPVFELKRAGVAVGGRTIEAFPLWTPQPGTVTGPLSLEAAPGRVALVTLPDGTGGGLGPPALGAVEAAVKAGPAAVIAITDNRVGEMSAVNALPNTPPWPVPVVIVAGREGAALRAAAQAGTPATVRLEGRTATRCVENVVARRPAPGKHLILSTPKSGWMTCAGERGAGVALWLGLARWLATTPHNLTLVATTAHEFDGHGGHLFTDRLAPKPADTKLWLHLGANIAGYDFALKDGRPTRLGAPSSARLAACSPALVPAVTKAFAGQPGYEAPMNIAERRPPGEAALFQKLGYEPLLALVGGHPLHHTPRDQPDVSGPELLEPVARALRTVLSGLG